MSNFENNLDQYYKTVSGNDAVRIAVECGDDRAPTAESSAALAKEQGTDPTHFGRVFGGVYGFARILLVTLAADPDTTQLERFVANRSFNDVTIDVAQRIKETTQLVPATHSAEHNEANPLNLNSKSAESLGCAYCAHIHEITALSSDPNVLACAATERPNTLGGALSTLVSLTTLSNANMRVHKICFSQENPISRKDVVESALPVLILAGSHAPHNQTMVVLNFEPHSFSNPTQAATDGTPFYDVHVTLIADALMRSFPGLKLDAGLLISVIEHDARATRAALTGGEPKKLAVTKRGSAQKALEYLKNR